jgi:hypothetical protein
MYGQARPKTHTVYAVCMLHFGMQAVMKLPLSYGPIETLATAIQQYSNTVLILQIDSSAVYTQLCGRAGYSSGTREVPVQISVRTTTNLTLDLDVFLSH